MNKIKKILREQPPSFLILSVVIAAILLCGLSSAVIVFVSTIQELELYKLPWCFTNECFKDFSEKTDQVFTIAKTTFDFGVAIATIGGIFVALLSYFNSSANSALTNHIEHLKIFTEYLNAEIKKRERLSASLIDSLYLYGVIFKQSRNGKTDVSDEYDDFIKCLNKIIRESNERCVIGTPGGFSYNDHQRRIRDHLATAGITVHTAPRNDYLEMEDQLFSLLHRISQSFCNPRALPSILRREYY